MVSARAEAEVQVEDKAKNRS